MKLIITSILILLILLSGTFALTSLLIAPIKVTRDTEFYEVNFDYQKDTKEVSSVELISKPDLFTSISKQKNSLFDMIEAYDQEVNKYEKEITPIVKPPIKELEK